MPVIEDLRAKFDQYTIMVQKTQNVNTHKRTTIICKLCQRKGHSQYDCYLKNQKINDYQNRYRKDSDNEIHIMEPALSKK